MGSKKKSTGIGFAQEAITLVGEFLEVSPRVRDQQFKIMVGPYSIGKKAGDTTQAVRVDKVGTMSSRQYKLEGSDRMTLDNFTAASGSNPWKFTLIP